MASSYPRGQIVSDALALAGRSSELKQSANQWLNYFLLHVGMTFQFPELRKIGATQTLPMGVQVVSLPADMGVGMANRGMIFGPDAKPMDEVSFEQFTMNGGFPTANGGTGRPCSYIVDKNANQFRFDRVADQAYSFTPIYFIKPPLLPVDTSSDSLPIWMDNDMIAVEGLIWFIYKYKEDDRENAQEMRVRNMILEWKRDLVKLGGTSRVTPSPSKFKTVKFGGFNGP